MAECLQSTDIRVAGHLEEKRGIYQIILNWKATDGKRKRQSISTGLPVKGNKTRAKGLLEDAKKEKKAEIEGTIGSSGKEGHSIHATSSDTMLFADYLEHWLAAIKNDVALTTYGGYETNVRTVIAPYFQEKGTTLSELTPQHLNQFYSEQKKRVKTQTVIGYHAVISNALNYAVANDFVEYSIMSTGKVHRPVVPKAQRFVGKFLKVSEAIEVFNKVAGHKLELGVILGAFYGLRRSEVVGLRWESIDFDANTITIEHTVTMATVDGKCILVEGDTTKSDKSLRTLPLIPAFRKKLLTLREEQEYYKKLCGRSYNTKESKYVYTDPLGNRVKPGYLTNAFPDWMERNGFRRMRFHDLRHSHASLLLADNIDAVAVASRLGHSDASTTLRTYAHALRRRDKDSADAMQRLLERAIRLGDKEEE